MTEGGAPPASELNIVGVRFSPTGRTVEYEAPGFALKKGDVVVVEDQHGLEVATVSVRSALRPPRGPLSRVVRLADARDLQRKEANALRAVQALALARERAHERRLDIKVFWADLALGGGRATFYFSSDGRVDFRDLVRDLSSALRIRIDMRQVGVRDEAKMVGGIGSCGRELCCTTFLPHFAPVSIKMAKHQNLVLNPAKVSGQCGRLKCCLVYEEAAYVEAGKKLPKPGKKVETPDGVGRVGDLDVLAGKIRVYFEDQPPRVYTSEEVRPVAPPAGTRAAPEADDGEEPPPGVPQN